MSCVLAISVSPTFLNYKLSHHFTYRSTTAKAAPLMQIIVLMIPPLICRCSDVATSHAEKERNSAKGMNSHSFAIDQITRGTQGCCVASRALILETRTS